MRFVIPLMLAGIVYLPAFADDKPYAGQDAREIKALAPEQIEGLLAGAGLGYAKAAELNGWPGPLHALELADALSLNADQRRDISSIREAMLDKARPLGAKLVEAEAALDALFATDTPDADRIAEASARVGVIEAELRAVHLTAHIETRPLLNRHQQMLYAQHRGYDAGHQHHGKH